MRSKTVTASKSGINKGTPKGQNDLEDPLNNTKTKMNVTNNSVDESLDDISAEDDMTDSDKEVAEKMDEEDASFNNEEGEDEGSMGEEEEKSKDYMSDSTENEDESRTVGDGDGVDFSDSDDNNMDEDDQNQNKDDGESNDIKVAANPAWAQAMAKILRTQKPSGKKAVALSKAKTIQAAESSAASKEEEEPEFEIVGEKEAKPQIKTEDIKPSAEELLQAKRERLAQCRVRQDDFDYNRERALTKIATKGVVQLFNAVRSQQKNLGSKLAGAHSTRMEEKLLKSIDKNSFLEHLTGKIRSRPVEEVAKQTKKEEVEIVLPKSWDELSKNVESGSWDKIIEIKEEPEHED